MSKKCWKCGKEISGFQESIVGLSVCPECETLQLLKDMREEQRYRNRLDNLLTLNLDDERPTKNRHSYVCEDEDEPSPPLSPTDKLAPEWWKKAKHSKTPGTAAVISFLAGEWGFSFMYIGGKYALIGMVMFFTFIALMILCPMTSLIYFFCTNFLLTGFFLSLSEDDFLKKFRKDLWLDKQIADKYGHETDEFGNYIDIPIQKPTWEEVFQSEKADASYSNVNEKTGDTKPPVMLRRNK